MDNIQTAQPSSFINKLASFLERKPVIYQFFRFVCIGFLNTGLNFLVLNFVSKLLGISSGWSLGAVSVIAFCAAVIQSYLWNRTWTFGGEQGVSLAKNLTRLVLVGALGVLSIVFVFIASTLSSSYLYYLMLLVVYLIVEWVLWRRFGFHTSDWNHEAHSFVVFFFVTLIGLGINYALISLISANLKLTGTDLDKNIAAALATAVSLVWNFVGYKLVVFKK